LEQKRKANAAPVDPLSDTQTVYRNRKTRFLDASKEFFKNSKEPFSKVLYDVFGPEFFYQANVWLDPLWEFRFTGILYSDETRYREKRQPLVDGFVRETNQFKEFRNYFTDDPNSYPEYFYEGSEQVYDSPRITPPISHNLEWIGDSTNSTRSWNSSYSNTYAYGRDMPSFGAMSLYRSKIDGSNQNRIYKTSKWTYFLADDNGPTALYRRIEDRFFIDIDGLPATVDSDLRPSDLMMYEWADTLLNEKIFDVLPSALANRRVFDTARNITELKDLPATVASVKSLRDLCRKLSTDPAATIRTLDKEIGNLYLSWKFGVESTVSAVESMMRIPEKAAKKLNYLIRRSGKISSGKSRRIYKNVSPPDAIPIPSFTYALPSWAEIVSQETTRSYDVEYRVAVNQSINFPKLAVPSYSDSNYRKILGLNLTPGDIYHLLPWTWLIDWFSSVGKYVDILQAMHADDQLINYGFATVIITETVNHKCIVKVTSAEGSEYTPIGETVPVSLSYSSSEQLHTFQRTWVRTFRRRVEISTLEGVITFGIFQKGLSDFQTKILAALFAQRS
jgi:hypothetical protein